MSRSSTRLSLPEVRQHLRIYTPAERRLAMELRRVVLREVPGAAERIAFHCLCYYLPDCIWGVIGGNICMISLEDDAAVLGFIHGAAMDDPQHLLRGKNKHKRHLRITSAQEAQSPAVAALIRSAVMQAQKARLS